MIPITTPMPILTGQFIKQGRLQLLEVLGSGGYGTVYRAIDIGSLELDKPVYYAVKVLYKSRRHSREHILNHREFSVHRSVCDHPNVLSVYDIICDESYIYVVLPLCSGDIYTAIIGSHAYHKDVELVKSTFIQIIDAVQHCHDNGVFHRDLKPENILCSSDGSKIYLADFGLASRREYTKDFGCGSTYYMSPECIGPPESEESVYSARTSDVWSLGVILANMITGRNPWRRASRSDGCYEAFLEDPDYLYRVLPISDGAYTILKRALAVNPDDRITLPEFREEILKLDTFFMSPEELKQAPEYLRQMAAAYATCVPPPRVVRSEDYTTVVCGAYTDSSDSSSDSDESDGHDEMHPIDLAWSTSAITRVLRSVDITDIDRPTSINVSPNQPGEQSLIIPDVDISEFVIGSLSSGSSDESEGPITPETHADDPVTEVPELAEAECLGQPAVVLDDSPTKKKLSSGVGILRNVVHRLVAR